MELTEPFPRMAWADAMKYSGFEARIFLLPLALRSFVLDPYFPGFQKKCTFSKKKVKTD